MKFGFDWPSSFRRCLKIMVIYMYLAPGQGQANPWGIFFINTIIQSIKSFTANFPHQITL